MRFVIYKRALVLSLVNFSLVAMNSLPEYEFERVVKDIRLRPAQECPPALPYCPEVTEWLKNEEYISAEIEVSNQKRMELARKQALEEAMAQSRRMLLLSPPQMYYVTKK